MKISVIIPVINEAERLGTTLDSAREAKADEIIVVDGGSNDRSREIAKEYKCKLVDSLPGRGPQQNRGANAATGDVLLFLHADCSLGLESLEQIRRLEVQGAFCGCFRQRILAKGWTYRLIERGNALRVRLRGLYYGDQAIFISRQMFDSVGGFPDEPLMEDLLLARRTKAQVWPTLLPGPVYVNARRWQRNGPIRQTIRNWLLVGRLYLGASPDVLSKSYRRHDRE